MISNNRPKYVVGALALEVIDSLTSNPIGIVNKKELLNDFETSGTELTQDQLREKKDKIIQDQKELEELLTLCIAAG